MAYWELVFRDFSTGFISDVQTLGAGLESHINALHAKMGQMVGLVDAPFHLHQPFLGPRADIYRQHAPMLLHETGYRVGGDEMARYVSQAYVDAQTITSIHQLDYYYAKGHDIGEQGVIGLFLERFKQLADIVEQHTEGVINRIRTECLSIPVTQQGRSLDNDIVFGIAYRMIGQSLPKEVLDRMFRLGGAFSHDTEVIQFYSGVVPTPSPGSGTPPQTSYGVPNPTPGPAPTPGGYPTTLSDQIISHAYLQVCQHLMDVIKGYGDALSRSYRAWNVDFDENVRLYFAKREHDFAELYNNWQMSAAQIYDKINAPSNKNVDQPIGITMGQTQDGQTAIVVTISGLQIEKWGHAFDLGGAVSEGIINESEYRQLTYNAIQQYLAEHHLPPNTIIIIAGHSLGGMVAEDLIDQYNPNTFNLQEVVTFGSPDQGSNFPNVTAPTQLHMYYSSADPVPYLPHKGKVLIYGDGADPNNSQGLQTDPYGQPYPDPQDPVQLTPDKYALLPAQRENEVTLPNIDPANGQTFDAHSAYGTSPDLQAGGKYGKLDFTLIGGTEYYSA